MTIGIVGLGYVGLPLAVAFAEAGERVIGVDTSVAKVASIRRGESYIEDIPSEQLAAVRSQLEATTRTSRLALADAIIIAVPTPLTAEPRAGPRPAARRRPVRLGRPPGRPAGRPRVDDLPGHDARAPAADPRGDRPAGRRRLPPGLLARARRSGQRDLRPGQHAEDHRRPHPRLRRQGRGPVRHASASRSSRSPPPRWPRWRSCSRTSSASVNIALVNELGMLAERMNVDIYEVIDAAATKPFGYMRFEPGPGMGGHCLPVDPFYLSWKAREHDFSTEFIELAGKVNQNMPYVCVERAERALNDAGKAVRGSKIAILGVAYKPAVGDIRESPSLKIIERLQSLGGEVVYHDEFVPELPKFGLTNIAARRGARRRGHRPDRHRPPGHRPHGDRGSSSRRSTTAGSPAPLGRQRGRRWRWPSCRSGTSRSSPRRWRHEASYDRGGPFVRRPGHSPGPAPDRRLPGRRLLRRPRLGAQRADRAAPGRRPRRRHAGDRERPRPPARGRRGRPAGQVAAADAADGLRRGSSRPSRPAPRPSSPRPCTRSRSARCCARSRTATSCTASRSAPSPSIEEDCPLTDRELEILKLVAEGHTNGRIARELWVTEQTVKFHLSNTYRKLGVANRTEASRYAHLHNLTAPRERLAS